MTFDTLLNYFVAVYMGYRVGKFIADCRKDLEVEKLREQLLRAGYGTI